MFYKNGKVWAEHYYVDDKFEGKAYLYTPNGDTAAIQIWEKSNKKYEKVFFFSTYAEPQKFYFVSKNGFVTMNYGELIQYDENSPDSLLMFLGDCTWIYLKGEWKTFKGECRSASFLTPGNMPRRTKTEASKAKP